MYERQHARIASGFFQTQLLDSMYNSVILLTSLSAIGINIEQIKVEVQGDDSLVAIPNTIAPCLHQSFLDMLADAALQHFGAILNTKKSKISSSLEGLPVLGFTNTFGIPKKEQDELLAHLLYPEHKSDENRLMARCIGIAFVSCGFHPKVYRICAHTYHYLAQLGFTPNVAGLPNAIIALSDWQETITNAGNLTFPSYFDTIAHLNQIPKRSEQQKEKT